MRQVYLSDDSLQATASAAQRKLDQPSVSERRFPASHSIIRLAPSNDQVYLSDDSLQATALF